MSPRIAIHKIYWLLTSILSIPMLILIPIATGILGILAAIPIIGILILLACSLLWLIIATTAYLCSLLSKIPVFGFILGIAGIPVVLVGELVLYLLPNMGEKESKEAKVLATSAFPFSSDFIQSYFLQKPSNDIDIVVDLLESETSQFQKIVLKKLQLGLPLDQ